ncbi:ABC transporter permease [Lichenihabitans sp. Uapishka_5]|uniref:ABC transporter permease n=1 Tax=Lichenihabitans sp. Uapishka_5 TaxID=3037302 RepID=UPI0029E7FBB3|nr:ABC transporter permease [Lichenihabitans sp. Uapishka_5]MDX7952110.1 ABC transporter permease [Lichenihabitans sp. Uapishka_5]
MADPMTLAARPALRASPFTRFRRWEASGALLALLALCALLAVASPYFFTAANLPIVLRNASFVGLVALGQTLVLLIGGIDLSVGAAAGLSAIVGALMLTKFGIHPYAVIPLTMGFGLLLGFANALFVAKLRLNPFIVTLASGEIFAGLNLVITQGYPVRPLGPQFKVFGQSDLFGLPFPVIAFFASAAILWWVLTRTRFGRNIYAVGGNRDAAALVGIRVWRVEFIVFGLAGMFAALAGILYASRMDAAQPSVGEGWMLSAITAAIIGGTSLRGGEGTIVGTVFGALLLTVLQNGTVLLNVSGYWQRVIIGAVVLVAVLVDLVRRR